MTLEQRMDKLEKEVAELREAAQPVEKNLAIHLSIYDPLMIAERMKKSSRPKNPWS